MLLLLLLVLLPFWDSDSYFKPFLFAKQEWLQPQFAVTSFPVKTALRSNSRGLAARLSLQEPCASVEILPTADLVALLPPDKEAASTGQPFGQTCAKH